MTPGTRTFINKDISNAFSSFVQSILSNGTYRGTRLGEDGGIFGSVESQSKPSHPTLTRVRLIPPLQLEIRTFIL